MDKTAAGCGSPSPEGVIVQTDALPKMLVKCKGNLDLIFTHQHKG